MSAEGFTDEQRAEWADLHDLTMAAHVAYVEAEREAGGWLVYAIEHPESDAIGRAKAEEHARDAIAKRDSWLALHEQTCATVYGTHLRARARHAAEVQA